MSITSQLVMFVVIAVTYTTWKDRDKDQPYGMWDLGPMGAMGLAECLIMLVCVVMLFHQYIVMMRWMIPLPHY